MNQQVPTRLINAALMVDSREIDCILSALKTGVSSAWTYEDENGAARDDMEGIAVISILGGLSYRGYGWCWRMTYGDIRDELRAALNDPEIKAIVLDIDSPGGEVAGVFDLVDEIYAARSIKPIYAIANEHALSAAYAIASAAKTVYLSRTACVGSVGVIAVHVDQSMYDKAEGLKYTAVYAGAKKNDLSPHEPLGKEAKTGLQKTVDSFYGLFVDSVARNRGISADIVKGTGAAIFTGQDAVSIGLADGVLSWDEVFFKVKSAINGGVSMKIEDLKVGMTGLMAENSAGVAEALKAMGFVPVAEAAPAPIVVAADLVAEVQPVKIETPAEAEANGKEAGAAEAIEHATEIIELCALGGKPEMAKEMIGARIPIAEAKKRILEARAAVGDEIRSTVGALSTGEVNPLLADAKSRAEAK